MKTKKEKHRGSHSLDCKYCGRTVDKVDINSVEVVCSRCVHKLVVGNPV